MFIQQQTQKITSQTSEISSVLSKLCDKRYLSTILILNFNLFPIINFSLRDDSFVNCFYYFLPGKKLVATQNLHELKSWKFGLKAMQ